MVPEKQFVECDPRLFGAAVAEHGVIILRSAIDRRKIARFKVKLEQAITYYSALTKSDIAKLDYQKWWPGNGVDFTYSMASTGHVNEAMLRDRTNGAISFYDLISDPTFHGLMAGAFPGLVF